MGTYPTQHVAYFSLLVVRPKRMLSQFPRKKTYLANKVSNIISVH